MALRGFLSLYSSEPYSTEGSRVYLLGLPPPESDLRVRPPSPFQNTFLRLAHFGKEPVSRTVSIFATSLTIFPRDSQATYRLRQHPTSGRRNISNLTLRPWSKRHKREQPPARRKFTACASTKAANNTQAFPPLQLLREVFPLSLDFMTQDQTSLPDLNSQQSSEQATADRKY